MLPKRSKRSATRKPVDSDLESSTSDDDGTDLEIDRLVEIAVGNSGKVDSQSESQQQSCFTQLTADKQPISEASSSKMSTDLHTTEPKDKDPENEYGLSSSLDTGLDMSSIYVDLDDNCRDKKKTISSILQDSSKDELLKNSVLQGLEKKHAVKQYKTSKKQVKKRRKAERESSTGRGWYDMKEATMTEELKRDLEALKMRNSLDPKRFYKKSDHHDSMPKYVQVARIVDNAANFYNSRLPKKERKKTLVEELLQDAQYRRYNKRKYAEIQDYHKSNANHKKKKKNKFRRK